MEIILLVVLIAAFAMVPFAPMWSPGPKRPILGLLDKIAMVFIALTALVVIIALWPMVT